MKMVQWQQDGAMSSALGLGCMRIAQMDAAAVDALMGAALDIGINLFDHADIYGGGESERRFGAWLKDRPQMRRQLLIQSKCGIRKGFYDLSKAHILESVDGSLARLGTDYLDMLLLHRPDMLMEPDEVADAFDALHKAGKVRAFGVSNQNARQMARLQRATPHKLCVNQLQWSLMHCGMIEVGLHVNTSNDEAIERDGGIWEHCLENGVTVQAWSPFQYGFFKGVFIDNEKFPELNAALREMGERYGASPSAIALAWILRAPGSNQVIIGTTNPGRVADLHNASDVVLSREDWYTLYRATGKTLP